MQLKLQYIVFYLINAHLKQTYKNTGHKKNLDNKIIVQVYFIYKTLFSTYFLLTSKINLLVNWSH